MSAVTDAQSAFYLTTGLTPSAPLDDAIAAAVIAGADLESAHLLKHLEDYSLTANGPRKSVSNDWSSLIVDDPESRMTRVLFDG